MSHTPHQMAEELPDHVDKMHALKQSDAHFAKLFDACHVISRAVHRAKTDNEPTDDFNMESMRKGRLKLKNQIYGMLAG